MELNSQDAPIMTLNYNLVEDLFSKLSILGKAYKSLPSKEQLVNFI